MMLRRDHARFFGMPRDSFDWTLFLTASALAVIGVINLYSATSVARAALSDIYIQQVYWLVLGGILGAVVAVIDYRHYERLGYLLYGAGIVFLVLVFILGKDIRGSSRWIAIGSFGFQPSEFMKLFLIIALAKYLHDDPRTEARNLKDLIAPAVLTAIPTLLILKQPDLGTALIHLLIFVTICLLTKIKWQTLVGITVSSGIALPVLWTYVLKDYQKQRVLVFLNPEANLLGSGWHAHHARVAIGAGGWKGQGFMQGTQNQFHFLPEQHSDFPFAVFAEDWGFLGCFVLVCLYGFLVLWAIRIAATAKDRFGAVLAIGVGALIFWHALFNLGMVTGLLPVVGVTLPLFSAGGSSVLTIMLGIGLLMNVSMRRFWVSPARMTGLLSFALSVLSLSLGPACGVPMPHLDKTDRVLALRRAALEQPEDDAPRLVYADALALAGDPDRAELIAIGCELASSRFRAIERPALPLREAALLEAHAARWTETLTQRGVKEVRFRRGFPSTITIAATAFERHASALLAEEPIEVVHLTGIEELRTKDLAALLDAASGPLARSDGGFTPKPRSPHVHGIGFPGATLDRRRIQTIFAKESVVSSPRMTSLSLARTSWDQAALRSFSWLEPAGATHVDLSHVTCRDVGAPRRSMNANAYVERSCAAEVLTSLLPRASHITMRGDALGVARLFDAIRKKQLVSLEAYVTGADDEILKTSLPRPQTVTRLCAESVRSVRELRLRGFGSYEILFPALAEATFLEDLTVLDLGERALLYPSSTDDAMHKAFAAMTKLVVLGLRGLELGWRRSIGELIDHPSRVSLRSLTLHGGDALGAIQYLVPPRASASSAPCSSKHLEGLTHLELGAPSLTSTSPEARLLRHRFGEGLTLRDA